MILKSGLLWPGEPRHYAVAVVAVVVVVFFFFFGLAGVGSC